MEQRDFKAATGATTPSGPAPAGPNRFLEILRRLMLLGGFLIALGLALWPAEALFRVRAVDFAKLQKSEGRRRATDLEMMSRVSGTSLDPQDPQHNPAPDLTLNQFIVHQTEGRLLNVGGAAWADFQTTVQQTLAGQSTAWARQLGDERHSACLYFPTNAPPLSEVADRFGDENPFYYVAVRDGDAVSYLEVLFLRPAGAFADAPNKLLFPRRHHAVWWLIGGLLAYALIPWHRKGPQELCYPRGRSVVVPDFLGLGLFLVFCALPILVIMTNPSSLHPFRLLDFTDGWGVLTLVCWMFALAGGTVMATALVYATFSLVVLPDGFRRFRLRGADECRFADIAKVEPAVLEMPRWLRLAGLFLGLFNWRLLGTVLLASSQRAFGMAIRCRDGRTLNLWVSDLPGFERVFRALKQNGVPLDDEFNRNLDADLADDAAEPSSAEPSSRAGRIAARVLLALAIGGALAWQFWPERVRTVAREWRYSDEQMSRRAQLLEEMRQVALQMKANNTLVPKASPADPSRTFDDFDALMKRYQELEQQYNAMQPTEED